MSDFDIHKCVIILIIKIVQMIVKADILKQIE